MIAEASDHKNLAAVWMLGKCISYDSYIYWVNRMSVISRLATCPMIVG